VLGLRNAVESPAFLAPHAHHACRGASSWCRIHTSLLIYLGFSASPSSSASLHVTNMSDDLYKLLMAQTNAVHRIRRIILNYKNLLKANVTLTKTKTHVTDLQKCWKEIQQLHKKITVAATPQDRKELSYFLKADFLVAEDAYKKAAKYFQGTITNFEKETIPVSHPDSKSNNKTQSPSLRRLLPRIPLPTFSGKYSEWEIFRDNFQSRVHSNKVLTNTEKFYYLKSSVSGDVAFLLHRFQVSSINYEDAWKILLKEYNHKRALVNTYIQSFLRLPNRKFETADELKKLQDTVSVALANLSKLGCEVSTWDPLIVEIISEKLGPQTKAKWNDQVDSRECYSYKELDAFLNSHIHSDSPGVAETVADNSQNEGCSSVDSVPVSQCVNCASNSHSLAKCEKFLLLSVEQRNTLATEKQVCFNCLRSGHFTPKCPSKTRCKHCRCKHHSLLHLEVDEETNSE